MKSYHETIAQPLLKKLIAEINLAFHTKDFPVVGAHRIFDPRYIPKSIDETIAKDVSIVCDWYGINKVDIYDGLMK